MGIPLLLAASAALILSGCARRTVKIPDTDATAPISALDVVGRGKRIVLFTGEQPVTIDIGPGDSVVLIALGEDRDGGIKDLSLSGNAVVHCGDASDRDPAVKTSSFTRRHVMPGLPGWRVPGTNSTRYVLKASDFQKTCGALELRGVTGAAGVRAVNFHGRATSSPTLQFRIAAPIIGPKTTSPTTTSQASQDEPDSRPVFGPLPVGDNPITPLI